jgi:Nuclease-related domain
MLLLVVLGLRYKRAQKSSYQLATILKPYIRDEIKDFIIPDGVGGLLEIEQLVLLDQGILLIQTYPISGNLFGADFIDEWTQIIDGKSFKFPNPLQHIRTSSYALKVLAPTVPIFCRIVFTGNSVFPKGKPDEVSVLSSLGDDLKTLNNSPVIIEKAQHSWGRLLRIARKDGQAVTRGSGVDGK